MTMCRIMVRAMARITGIGLLVAGLWAPAGVNAVAGGLADPMRPSYVYGGGTARAGLVLQSTVISGQRKSAIISGRLLHEGERIGKARVVEIRRNEVVLKKGKRLIHLRVMPKLAKKIKPTQIEDNDSKK